MTDVQVDDNPIMGYECKHAVYTQANDGSDDDVVVIKEWCHYKDGSKTPRLRFIKNYERPFYVTREGHRNHEQKKEWEDIRKLQRFKTRQSRLIDSVARALGRPGFKGSYKMLCRSPYVYGTDITTPTLIKHQYMQRYPECRSDNSVAVLDIETDVVNHDPNDRVITYLGVTFKDKALLLVTKAFIGTLPEPEKALQKAFTQYLGEFQQQRHITLEAKVVDTPGDVVKYAFMRLHEWQPDFVAIWNIAFDFPAMEKALTKEGYSPADVFSDPKVPPRFRFYTFKHGPTKQKTAAGTEKPIIPAEQWHEVEAAASFYPIDAMCLYRRLRMAQQKEPYGLDYQLGKHLDLGKLRFSAADGLEKLEWHIFMQKHYKIEYGIYCLFDCIGVELLDEKNKDIAQSISVQGSPTEYRLFKSQPKRLVDDLHFFVQQYDKVIGSCGDQMVTDIDKHVIGRSIWIMTLPPHTLADNGLAWIKERPWYNTMIRTHVADQLIRSLWPVMAIVNFFNCWDPLTDDAEGNQQPRA